MIDYTAILTANYVGAQWSLNNNDYDTLEWYDSTPKPTQAELDAQWASVQQKIADEAAAKVATRQAVLDKLGLTAEEVTALLG